MENKLGLQRTHSINGCDYASWSSGDGQPIILLHGWPVTSRHWLTLVPILKEQGYSTHCIDLRGLGDSKCLDGNFSKSNLASEILQIVEILIGKDQAFAVIGHDWGGSIAVGLASLSKKIKCLIVEEEILPGLPAVIPEPGASFYPTWHGGFHRQKPLAENLILGSVREYFDFFLRLRANPESLPDAERKLFLSAYMENIRIPIFLQYYRTNVEDEIFFRGFLNFPIAIPILCLAGKFGMGSAVFESIQSIFLNTKFGQLEESGHYPAQEQPKIFLNYVQQFFHQNGFK